MAPALVFSHYQKSLVLEKVTINPKIHTAQVLQASITALDKALIFLVILTPNMLNKQIENTPKTIRTPRPGDHINYLKKSVGFSNVGYVPAGNSTHAFGPKLHGANVIMGKNIEYMRSPHNPSVPTISKACNW